MLGVICICFLGTRYCLILVCKYVIGSIIALLFNLFWASSKALGRILWNSVRSDLPSWELSIVLQSSSYFNEQPLTVDLRVNPTYV